MIKIPTNKRIAQLCYLAQKRTKNQTFNSIKYFYCHKLVSKNVLISPVDELKEADPLETVTPVTFLSVVTMKD